MYIPDWWIVYEEHGQYSYIPMHERTDDIDKDIQDAIGPHATLIEMCGTEDAAKRSVDACYKLYAGN
jgi:hypothetical protein